MATWSAFPFEKNNFDHNQGFNHYFPYEKQIHQQNRKKAFLGLVCSNEIKDAFSLVLLKLTRCFWRRISLHCHRIFHCILTILLLSSSVKQFSLSFGHTLIHLNQGINALYQVWSKLHLFHNYLPLKLVMTLRFIEHLSPPNALCQSLVK